MISKPPESPSEDPEYTPPPPPPPPSSPPPPPPQSSPSAAPPSTPAYPPGPTPTPKSGKISGDKIVIVVLVIIAIAAAAIYLGVPSMKLGNPGASAPVTTSPQTQGISFTQAPARIQMTTAYPVTYPPTTAISSYKTVFIRNEPYNQIFSSNKQFDKDQVDVYPLNLQQPPMIVQFELSPKLVSDQKLVDIGTTNERYITATYPSPTARFDLKIINADTGRVETTLIYRANYNGMEKQEYTVRNAGNYNIQMSGNEVTANVAVLVKQS